MVLCVCVCLCDIIKLKPKKQIYKKIHQGIQQKKIKFWVSNLNLFPFYKFIVQLCVSLKIVAIVFHNILGYKSKIRQKFNFKWTK